MQTEFSNSRTLVIARGAFALAALTLCASGQFALAAEPPLPKPPVGVKGKPATSTPSKVADAGKPVLGATIEDVEGKLQIMRVQAGGPADRAGLRRGDTVLSIGSQQVGSYDDVATALARHRPQDRVAIVVERDGDTRTFQTVMGDSRGAVAPANAALPAAAGEAPAAADAAPLTINGQDMSGTVQGFAQMLREATQGLRRNPPAGTAPAGTAPAVRRRPLLERLGGTDAAAANNAAPAAGDVQVDLGQESSSTITGDLADQPAATEGPAVKPRSESTAEGAPARRTPAARPRPRLERLRERLGKTLDGAETPAFEGGVLQPTRPLTEEPAPQVVGRRPLPAERTAPEELPQPEPTQNRRASTQQPLDRPAAKQGAAKPALGVTLKLRDAGVVVSAITAGSAAEQAGLQVGDVLSSIDGQPVASVADATEYIASQRPGDQLQLKVQRAGRERLISATLGTRAGER